MARVYPIRRMPRGFGAFDYDIPQDMTIARGDMVAIPFRASLVYGIVHEVLPATKSSYARKPLGQRVEGISLTAQEMLFFESLAQDVAQSVSSVLDAALPTPPKRASTRFFVPPAQTLTLPKSEAPIIVEIAKRLTASSHAFVMSPDLRRSASVISAYADMNCGRVMTVITPTIQDAVSLASCLHHHRPLLLTGEETPASRYRLWREWREKKNGLLIGTRLALLHTHPDLATVFLVRSGHEQHKQTDRNPRYDARRLALQLFEQSRVSLFFLDAIPLTEDGKIFSRAEVMDLFEKPETHVLPLTSSSHEPHPLLAYQTVEIMERLIQEGKRLLCVYNKKGVSRQLLCQDCGYDFLCETCRRPRVPYEQTLRCPLCLGMRPMPMSCPSCKGTHLQPKGFGNRALEATLQKLFPHVSIARIDRETETPRMEATILLVTDYYLERFFDPFRPPSFGGVIKLDTDLWSSSPSFHATDEAMRSLEEWRGVARACRATFMAQTRHPETVEAWLSHPYQTHQKELAARQLFGHPPFQRWMRIDYRSDKHQNSEQALADLQKSLQRLAKDTRVFKRKNGAQTFLELCCPFSSTPSLLSFLATLPDAYIIDTNTLF